MNYTYKKKNTILVFILLFISCIQPVYASEPASLFFNNKLNSEWLKKNKLYIGGTLLLGTLILYLRHRSNSNSNNGPQVNSVTNVEISNLNDQKDKVNPENFVKPVVDDNPKAKEETAEIKDQSSASKGDNPNKKRMFTVLEEVAQVVDNKNASKKNDFHEKGLAEKIINLLPDSKNKQFTDKQEIGAKGDSEKQKFKKNPEIKLKNQYVDQINPFTSIADIQRKAEGLTDDQCNNLTDILIENFNNSVSDQWVHKKIGFLDLDCCPLKFLNNQPLQNKERIKISMAKQALSSYVFCNAKIIELTENFLQFKRDYGTDVEMDFYFKKNSFTPFNFIQRAFCRRPMVFVKENDCTVLDKNDLSTDGQYKSQPKKEFFDNLPNDAQNMPRFMTYDEMAVSTFLCIHSNTFPVNKGDRRNGGKKGIEGKYENQEVGITNLVGVRLERSSKNDGTPGLMGWRFFIIDKHQNTYKNGYGLKKSTKTDDQKAVNWIKMWEVFYQTTFPTYEEADQDTRNGGTSFVKLVSNDKEVLYFHVKAYSVHMKLILVMYFFNLFKKYENTDTKVYVSTVGLGTGEWATIKKDGKTFAPVDMPMSTFLENEQIALTIEILKENESFFKNICDIDFAFLGYKTKKDGTGSMIIDKAHTNAQYDIFEKTIEAANGECRIKVPDTCYRSYQIKCLKNKFFRIHLSQRPPFEKLMDEDAGKKIEAVCPGDSNSRAGNEALTFALRNRTGESAMFCATLMGTHHNPDVNRYVLENIVILYQPEL